MFDQNWLKRYMQASQGQEPQQRHGIAARIQLGEDQHVAGAANSAVPERKFGDLAAPPTGTPALPDGGCAANGVQRYLPNAVVPSDRDSQHSAAQQSRQTLGGSESGCGSAPFGPMSVPLPPALPMVLPPTLPYGGAGEACRAPTSYMGSSRPDNAAMASHRSGGASIGVCSAQCGNSAMAPAAASAVVGVSGAGMPGPLHHSPLVASTPVQNGGCSAPGGALEAPTGGGIPLIPHGAARHASQWSGFGYGNEGEQVRNFVVMSKEAVEVRASPTYADDARVGHYLQPGQVLAIDERRIVQGSAFLHLADGRGWVFETKDRLLVLTEAHNFERGFWHYSVMCEDDVETRFCPTYSDDARTGVVLGSGDCFAVDERCSAAGGRFFKIADGRGWVFESKDRLLVMSEVRAKAQEARDFARGLWHYTVACDDDVEIRAAPTYSDEARTGMVLHPGDCVAVDERCRIAAAWFLRLADGRGWIFETKDSKRVMLRMD